MTVYIRQVDSGSYAITQNPIVDGNGNTKYQRFTMDRIQADPYEDVWRLATCQNVTLGQSSGTVLTYTNSNWESAVQVYGEGSLSCGLHGYEDYQAFRIYGDNIRIYPTTSTATYNDVRVEVDSNFFKPSSPSTKVGHINRIYYFNGTDLQLSQYYNFDIDTSVDILYAGMYPAAITPYDHGQLDGQSEENLRSRATTIHTDSDMITWRHSTTGLYTSMEVTDGTADYIYNGTNKSWIRTVDDTYNKGYVSRCNLYDTEPVNNGDTIHTRVTYSWWFE